jgi:hypothetical protein
MYKLLIRAALLSSLHKSHVVKLIIVLNTVLPYVRFIGARATTTTPAIRSGHNI